MSWLTEIRCNRIYASALAMACCAAAPATAVEMTAGDWKFTANGNVNVHYIGSSCEDETTPAVAGGLACRGSAGEDRTSSISNGLLPAALALGASTTQNGYDIAVTFGFYPGISTNDGSPNLQQGAGQTNTALGTASIDMRQVFLTFGNDHMGQFLLGRNIGLFGADAILNDMTLPGVGAGNGNYATPSNTSLGSIGLGYIYTDWLAQIDYTTRDFGGFKFTLGIFDPLEPLGQALPPGTAAPPESTPGFHAKAAFTKEPFYFSASRHQPETQRRHGRIRLRQFRLRHGRQDHIRRRRISRLVLPGRRTRNHRVVPVRPATVWATSATPMDSSRSSPTSSAISSSGSTTARATSISPRAKRFRTWWKRTRSTRSAPTTR